MAHEEKLRGPRNILLEPDLELEMSGIDERGVKPPPIRLPGKTHLAGVLLTANPWEKRDLDRRLRELSRLQVQKERAHVWAQRRFFMNRIFDSDMSLRFGKLDVERELGEKEGHSEPNKSGMVSHKRMYPGNRPLNSEKLENIGVGDNVLAGGEDFAGRPGLYRSKTDMCDNSVVSSQQPLRWMKSKNSLGIFATPLPENQRKFKICSTTAGALSRSKTMNVTRTVKRQPTISRSHQDEPSNNGVNSRNETINDDAGTTPANLNPALIEKSQTTPHILLRRATAGLELQSNTTTATSDLSLRSRQKPKRDVSFKKEAAVIIEDSQNIRLPPTPIEEDADSEGSDHHLKTSKTELKSRSNSGTGVICDEAVIVNLTRTLPTVLMLKANANLNAVINDRKSAMMMSSREISTRDTFSDERWMNLQSTLVPR